MGILDGFQYSTPNTEPIRRALEEQDDATISATRAGNEEAFLPPEERPIAPGNPPAAAMILSFFPTAEGYYDYENLRYIYQYKDHLGNVRVSYVKEGGSLKVMDSNDYYPFGLSFMKPAGGTSQYDPLAVPYNYKYNGKELQETGMYDYGARFYMPDIGRWGVVDPLSEQYRRHSTYNYAVNNPIDLLIRMVVLLKPLSQRINKQWMQLKKLLHLKTGNMYNLIKMGISIGV